MQLFDPLPLRDVTLRNRIGVAPMCQYSCDGDGMATAWHLVHLGSYAAGGAGLVIAEATAVQPQGRITPRDLGLWSDAQVEPLQRVTQFVRQQGAVPAIQLAHAGRKASTRWPWDERGPAGAPVPLDQGGWQPVAPSPVAFGDGHWLPAALDEAEIQQIIADFAAAARRAADAGFQVVEVHAAHGYLLHQFLSPLANHRHDAWGGDFANRTRLVLRVVEEVRAAFPERLPVWVRLSATDWVEGGWDADQTVQLSRLLGERGVDLVDVSSGGAVPYAQVPAAPGFQVPFAARVRREAGVASAAVGLITEPAQAAAIVEQGEADVVLLARELLRDPHWPQRAARALGLPVPAPVQYRRGW